jgi:general secretion pathway protein D
LPVVEQNASVPAGAMAPIPKTTAPLPLLPVPAIQSAGAQNRIIIPTAKRSAAQELYTVVVQKIPVSEVLFAIARDTTLDLDIKGKLSGTITLNAVQQPLELILQKIARQVPLRYQFNNDSLFVEADEPVIKTYRVDYLNISRTTTTSVELSTQVGSLRTTAGNTSAAEAANGSHMRIENTSENQFWNALVGSVAGIIGESAGGDSEADDSEAGNSEHLFVNREAGLLTVRASAAQHRLIGELISNTVASAKRQVLIEATVVEVTLNDSFESGVDWSLLDRDGGVDYTQLLAGVPQAADVSTAPTNLLTYRNSGSAGDVTATLKLLQQFGDVQVLSSPKIIALNNQPAVLKVVDNRVYFTFEVSEQENDEGEVRTQIGSVIHSVPVGLVMNVTAFISASDEVILNVRPTISRILNFAEDPAPSLAGQTQIRNLIPEIQVREMESLLRVNSGEVAIIGGLMQNRRDSNSTGLPGVAKVPLFGRLFSHDTDTLEKTELLVFLRPTVIGDAELDHHADHLRRFVPHQRQQLLVPPVTAGVFPGAVKP